MKEFFKKAKKLEHGHLLEIAALCAVAMILIVGAVFVSSGGMAKLDRLLAINHILPNSQLGAVTASGCAANACYEIGLWPLSNNVAPNTPVTWVWNSGTYGANTYLQGCIPITANDPRYICRLGLTQDLTTSGCTFNNNTEQYNGNCGNTGSSTLSGNHNYGPSGGSVDLGYGYFGNQMVINAPTTPNTYTYYFCSVLLNTNFGQPCVSNTITVVPPTYPTCTLTANPTSVAYNGRAELSYTTTNATSETIDNGMGAAPGPITFNSNGTWTVPPNVTSVTYLLVGGGGGGAAGGGGGGGFVYGTRTVTPGTVMSVSIGAGGTAGNSNGTFGGNGGNTILSWAGNTVTAAGGGGGGGSSTFTAQSGGSGGGGGNGGSATTPAGAGTSGQGNAGGTGFAVTWLEGGGGGGAGAVGAAGVKNTGAQTRLGGGIGLPNPIPGSTAGQLVSGVYYLAGGGGGGTDTRSGDAGSALGGTGGGGNGGYAGVSSHSVAGTANTGGGGGAGGFWSPTYQNGSAGGSGVAVLYYSMMQTPPVTVNPTTYTMTANVTISSIVYSTTCSVTVPLADNCPNVAPTVGGDTRVRELGSGTYNIAGYGYDFCVTNNGTPYFVPMNSAAEIGAFQAAISSRLSQTTTSFARATGF